MDPVIFRYRDLECSFARYEIDYVKVCLILGLTDKQARCRIEKEFSEGVRLVPGKENLLIIHDVEMEADPSLIKAVVKYVGIGPMIYLRGLIEFLRDLREDQVCICERAERDDCKNESGYEANIWNTKKTVGGYFNLDSFTILSGLDNPANIVSISLLGNNYDLVMWQVELDPSTVEDMVGGQGLYPVSHIRDVEGGREVVFSGRLYMKNLFCLLITCINMHVDYLRMSKSKSAKSA